MKKLFIFLIIICAIHCNAFAEDMNKVGIGWFDGVVLVDQGEGNWFKAALGMEVKEGTIIKTGRNGIVDIVFDPSGRNVVTLDTNTQVVIGLDSVKVLCQLLWIICKCLKNSL
jgi:hypothetical protein